MHPREFGRYRILKLLPKGGMGSVYLALDTSTGGQVALKLIDLGPDQDRQEIAAAERHGALLQEMLCRRDPRIAQIRSFGELEGFFYIEMEYVEGHDLSELLRNGALGIPFATRIAQDLCEVLAQAHGFTVEIEGRKYRGVVHGDIKPRNIRITPQGEVRVLDFGIARALSMTRNYTQIRFGSSQYSSPERLLTGDVNVASDLWGIAVVLYETVTARPYFEAETGPKVEGIIRNYRAVRPLPPALPVPFSAVLRKALHPEAEARYQSAEEFAADLQALREGRRTAAESITEDPDSERTRRTPASEDERDSDPTRRTAAAPANTPADARRQTALSTHRKRRYAAVAILVILLGLFGFVWHEVNVWKQGDALARELQTESLPDLNAAWVRYQELSDRNHLPLVLHTPRRRILERLISTADQTILDFRNSETLTVTETDWLRAQAVLSKALRLEPNDREIRGKLFVCEGHIARIRGTSRLLGKMLNESRAKFEQAREAMPKSPDPWLGLARLYVYSLKDVEKGEDALKAAAKRGHEIGRREKAQLADGYRDRAERLLREADRATGLPEEKDYLERVSDDFRRAQDLYRDVVPFANSTASLRRVLEYTENVDLRLRAIREGA